MTPNQPSNDYQAILGEYKQVDFYAIASDSFHRLMFFVSNVKPKCDGSGVFDRDSGKVQSLHDYMVDGLEKWPGVKIDRVAMHGQWDKPKKTKSLR